MGEQRSSAGFFHRCSECSHAADEKQQAQVNDCACFLDTDAPQQDRHEGGAEKRNGKWYPTEGAGADGGGKCTGHVKPLARLPTWPAVFIEDHETAGTSEHLNALRRAFRQQQVA